MFLKRVEEVVGISFGGVFDGKVVLNECKGDWPGVMLPQARCDWAWPVAMGSKETLELVIGQAAGLWQSVHTFANLNIDSSLVD